VSQTVLNYVDILLNVLTFLILAEVLMSWVSPRGRDPISPILHQVTEPILDPIRRILPQTGMFDLSPMVAILVLNFLVRPLIAALAT
jgi:YggT family protein